MFSFLICFFQISFKKKTRMKKKVSREQVRTITKAEKGNKLSFYVEYILGLLKW
jgi:hypothetical protein